MLKLLSVAALASAFVLSTATVTSAKPGGQAMPGGHGMRGGGFHFQSAPKHFKGPIKFHQHIKHHYTPVHLGHHHHRHFHWRHGSYWAVGVPVAAVGVAAYAASGPAPVCTCLVKDYLDDGSVRFTDTCTKESAISMAPEPAPVK